jgi:thiol:disulfide interchange protein DsbC
MESSRMKLPLFALLCALSVSACAQATPAGADTPAAATAATDKTPAAPAAKATVADPSKEAMVRSALKSLNPQLEVESVSPAPIPGFQQAIVQGQVVYLSNDGRYMLQGSLFDMHEKQDLGEVAMSKLRREQLQKVPATDRIVFAPVGVPKHTVSVFTDIECGYCRKMHSEMAEYNKRGISIEYLAFPRAGLTSADAVAMESVWCSDDRRKALTDAKNSRPVPPKRCSNPVASQYKLGQRLGLQGTPMAINSEGFALPGYLPPDRMLEVLNEMAAKAKSKAAGSR